MTVIEALQEALDHAGNTHTLNDVARCLDEGDAFLFAGERSAIVMEVHDFPLKTVAQAWLGGGDLGEITNDLRPRIEAWAKARGCDRILIIGRSGWERALAADGYRPLARVISKELK